MSDFKLKLRLVILIFITLLTINSNLSAQSLASYGTLVYSFNAASPANGTGGTYFAVPQRSVGYVTWCSSFSSNPSDVSISLQISNDNSVWTTVATDTTTSGACNTSYISPKFVRAYLTSQTGGGTITVSFNILPAWGNSVGPFGLSNNNAQFDLTQNNIASGTKPIFQIRQTDDNVNAFIIQNSTVGTTPNSGLSFYIYGGGVGSAKGTAYILNSTDGLANDIDIAMYGAVLARISSSTIEDYAITSHAINIGDTGTNRNVFLADSTQTLIQATQTNGLISESFGSGGSFIVHDADYGNIIKTTGGQLGFQGDPAGSVEPSTFNSGVYIKGSGSRITGDEITTPAEPGADRFRIYGKDNGAGKTQVCIRFHTGAEQCIATEP